MTNPAHGRSRGDPLCAGFPLIIKFALLTQVRFAIFVRHKIKHASNPRQLRVRAMFLKTLYRLVPAQQRLVFGIFASIAEFERKLIRERVRSGIAVARAQGKCIGRPRRPVDLNKVRELRSLGWSWAQIARELGAGLGTVHRAGQ